jgi:hypothetical protein
MGFISGLKGLIFSDNLSSNQQMEWVHTYMGIGILYAYIFLKELYINPEHK